MRMSQQGRKLLTQREGLRLKAYKDSVGVWTIGVGHAATSGIEPIPRAGMTITREQADSILSRDLVTFENAVNNAVKVPLTQGQFDALVSLAFNIGVGGFRKSTVVRRLNEGNYRGAADAFLMWAKPSVLIGRRRSERQQFLDATGKKPAGKPVRFVAAAELHDGETVGTDYLRAAGSRTISAVDSIKTGVKALGVGEALGVASQVKEYATQAQDISEGFKKGAPPRELLESYWPFFFGVGASILIGLIIFLLWDYARRIERARVDDAVYNGD